jgi:hypothetical protein
MNTFAFPEGTRLHSAPTETREGVQHLSMQFGLGVFKSTSGPPHKNRMGEWRLPKDLGMAAQFFVQEEWPRWITSSLGG